MFHYMTYTRLQRYYYFHPSLFNRTLRFIFLSSLLLLSDCFSIKLYAANSELSSYRSAIASQQQVKDLIQFEVNSSENIKIIDDGNRHIGLFLGKNEQKVNKGVRAEISIDYPFKALDTVTYQWEMKIPIDFKSDAPRNRWWAMAQWHDQPNRDKNETWDDHPSQSPPVALYYGVWQGKDVLSLHYKNHITTESDLILFQRGEWLNIKVTIHWSKYLDGFLKIYVNNQAEPIISKIGANMHNSYQHYLKLGMYREPSIKTDNWIYLKNLAINHN